MSDEPGAPAPGPDSEPLQFDRVEPVAEARSRDAGAALECGACQQRLVERYFAVNGRIFCERCCNAIKEQLTGPAGARVYLRATLRGLGAAAVGSALYYAVRALTGYELGLIAIVVGYLVGASVRKSAGGRGGFRFQALAMLLTYAAITSTYVPELFKAIRDKNQPSQSAATDPPAAAKTGAETPAAGATTTAPTARPHVGLAKGLGLLLLGTALLFLLAMAAPVLAGFQNLIGLVIIGIALYEAWKLNKRPVLNFSGPLAVGDAVERSAAAGG